MTLRKFIFTTFWLLVTVVPVLAQAACPALVNQALDAIGDNCAELDRNSACYGFDRVDTLFAVPQPADFFSQPTDRTDLVNLQTIHTFPLDTATGRFGVAVLNVQANVPESLPGQGVIFMLVGDAEMNNAVEPDEAVEPVEAVEVTTAADTPLFALPSTTANTRSTATAGTTLLADGFSATGDFLRIVSNSDVAWVPVDAITPDAALDSLPTFNSTNRTPMQAFYFSTGVGQPACNEAEASVAVQSPENITVDLTVNGVDIQVGSLVTFTDSSITVHRGEVNTSLGQTIEANETLELDKDEDGNFTGNGELRDISDEEFARGERVQDGINDVAENNGWDTREITPRDDSEVLDDGTIIHIVQPGESLFSIATLYDASMPVIAGDNALVDPFIVFVGQRLRITNPGSGFVGLGVRPNPTGDGITTVGDPTVIPPLTGLDCGKFALLGGGGGIISTFSWTPVSGADQYKLNIFGSDGNFVTSVVVTAPTTSIDLNMGDYGTGATFQWEVEALQGGLPFCNTGRSSAAPKPVDNRPGLTPQPGIISFTASRVCSGDDAAFVTWADAPAGSTVNIFGDAAFTGPDYNQNFTETSNTVFISVPAFDMLQAIVIKTVQGATTTNLLSLGGCP